MRPGHNFGRGKKKEGCETWGFVGGGKQLVYVKGEVGSELQKKKKSKVGCEKVVFFLVF